MRTVPFFGRREFPGGSPPRDGGRRFGFACRDFVSRSPPRDQYEVRRNDRDFESQRNYRPRFPSRGASTPPVRRDRMPMDRRGRVPMMSREMVQVGRCGRVDFANPSFEQMARH